MRKYLTIPLFFLYFFAVTGVIIKQHYCLNTPQMAMEGQNNSKPNCCSHHQKPEQKTFGNQQSCCQQRTIIVKTIHNQISESAYHIDFVALQNGFTIPSGLRFLAYFPATYQNKACYGNAPPGNWQAIPLYKLHQRFTYYS